jgi:hypothetical protein
MAAKDRVSVRALAEFALECGDLMRETGALDRMLEGAQGHRLLQSATRMALRARWAFRFRRR